MDEEILLLEDLEELPLLPDNLCAELEGLNVSTPPPSPPYQDFTSAAKKPPMPIDKPLNVDGDFSPPRSNSWPDFSITINNSQTVAKPAKINPKVVPKPVKRLKNNKPHMPSLMSFRVCVPVPQPPRYTKYNSLRGISQLPGAAQMNFAFLKGLDTTSRCVFIAIAPATYNDIAGLTPFPQISNPTFKRWGPSHATPPHMWDVMHTRPTVPLYIHAVQCQHADDSVTPRTDQDRTRVPRITTHPVLRPRHHSHDGVSSTGSCAAERIVSGSKLSNSPSTFPKLRDRKTLLLHFYVVVNFVELLCDIRQFEKIN
ncbi:hypothetical protein Fcan01_21005 [Folsomia candida]|uniref:Uncharacterized protein n=1 Tax=Folsomia candida TaxID=158441 RepID=A0A226DHW7_FOLCA|nr:hypothetical protein Fcan01_21005 [Folsomia candida]